MFISYLKVVCLQLKGYNAGGAGYVLSRAALALFVEKLASNRTLCPLEQYEDVGIGKSDFRSFFRIQSIFLSLSFYLFSFAFMCEPMFFYHCPCLTRIFPHDIHE